MEKFDFITYMLDCAVRLKDIQHTEENQRFFRISGISQLEELLANLPDVSVPALMVENNEQGRFSDPGPSDNFLDIPYFAFFVIDKAPFNDFDQIEAVKSKTKAIGLKILSRMLNDRRHYRKGLVMLKFDSVPYQSIGPIGDNCFGTMFSFTVQNMANTRHNPEDWLPEEKPE